MNINVTIRFEGMAKEVIDFYSEVLKVQAEIVYYEMMGEEVEKEYHDWILHSDLKVGNASIMITDVLPNRQEVNLGNNVGMSFNSKDADEIKRAYDLLSENAIKIIHPLEKTFWSPQYAVLIDKYGIHWSLNQDN